MLDDKLIWDLMDQERAENEHMIDIDHLEMIERMQKVLDISETEKKKLSEENQDLLNVLEKSSTRIKQLDHDNESLQIKFNDILVELGHANTRIAELELDNQKLDRLYRDIKESNEKVTGDFNDDSEKRIKEVSVHLERLASENKVLHDKLSNLVSANNCSEESSSYYLNRVQDIQKNYNQLTDEYTSLKQENDGLYSKIRELEDRVEAKDRELQTASKRYNHEIEKLNIDYMSKIKEASEGLSRPKEIRITGLEALTLNGLNFNESLFGGLAFEEREKFIKQNAPQLYESFLGIMENRNTSTLKNQETTQIESKVPTGTLKSIELINGFRQKLIDTLHKCNLFNEDEVAQILQRKNLLGHETTTEADLLNLAIETIEDILLMQKLRLQDQLADQDKIVVEFNKSIKMLKYKLGLYEEQIIEFNSRVKVISKTIVPI